MSITLKNKSFHGNLIFLSILFFVLVFSRPGFAFDLLTYNSTDLQYNFLM